MRGVWFRGILFVTNDWHVDALKTHKKLWPEVNFDYDTNSIFSGGKHDPRPNDLIYGYWYQHDKPAAFWDYDGHGYKPHDIPYQVINLSQWRTSLPLRYLWLAQHSLADA